MLAAGGGRDAGSGYDVAFVIADGLSARAVAAHAQPLLSEVLPRLADWRIAPLVVARLGRVALGDAVANALSAEIAVMLIGERPGLSAPDSMGAYLTFAPTPATTDAERDCISNIRPEGLGYADAGSSSCISCAPCARGGSRALRSRTTPTDWRSRRGEHDRCSKISCHARKSGHPVNAS